MKNKYVLRSSVLFAAQFLCATGAFAFEKPPSDTSSAPTIEVYCPTSALTMDWNIGGCNNIKDVTDPSGFSWTPSEVPCGQSNMPKDPIRMSFGEKNGKFSCRYGASNMILTLDTNTVYQGEYNFKVVGNSIPCNVNTCKITGTHK